MAKEQKELSNIEKQIAELEAQRDKILQESLTQALVEARELVHTFNFTASELGISRERKTPMAIPKQHIKPKFHNPSNPSQNWTGRGKPPRWFSDLLEQGATKDDLLIPV